MVSILIGEGGSGGALGLAVTDEVWMMENATYSILSPEGFASILWKDGKRAKEASEVMKITAKDLKKLQIIEKVIREPEPANEENLPEIAEEIREDLDGFLREKLSEDKRTDCGRTVRKISSNVGEKMKALKIGELTARIPVIQGGMGVGISLSGLAGSVAACGGVGVISTAQIGYRDPEFEKIPSKPICG